MGVAVLSLSDRFYELGNSIFKVEGLEYKGSCELYYESSEDVAINKVFNEIENGTYQIVKYIFSLKAIIYGLFIRNKKDENDDLLKERKYKIKGSNIYQSANSVISSNVRNRLLNTINEDIYKYKNKDVRASHKSVIKPKNQFIMDIELENTKINEHRLGHVLRKVNEELSSMFIIKYFIKPSNMHEY